MGPPEPLAAPPAPADGSPGPKPGYRPCVGLFLLDPAGRVFVGRRSDVARAAWQLPQGGIDPGEAPLEAALRELHEEVGTRRAVPLRVSSVWRSYDLPPDLAARVWGGRYRGQTQLWVALRFAGTDADVRLDAHGEPEFDAWRWADPAGLVDLAAPFKRAVYADVVEEFRPLWEPGRGAGDR